MITHTYYGLINNVSMQIIMGGHGQASGVVRRSGQAWSSMLLMLGGRHAIVNRSSIHVRHCVRVQATSTVWDIYLLALLRIHRHTQQLMQVKQTLCHQGEGY